jgi:predicted anti-sigma-YlaC factor YlaD
MIQCDRIQESLERWLDGELDAVETENVRAHVAGCATCSAARQRFEKIEGALKQVFVVEAPKVEFTSFWHELDRRIHRKIPWYRGLLDRVRGWEGTPRSAWAVPVLIALLLALFSVESYFPFWRSRNNLATVVSIDSHGRNVALLREDESKTTVIWLYQNQEDDDEAAEETPQPGPAF